MQLSLSLRRAAALAGAAALLALPQVAAAATEVTLDDSVTATIENAEGVQAHGALDADPFTYTVKSRVKCEEPYVDGARTVFVQGEGAKATRVVMSGIDSLEKDGTVVNPIDASFVDVAAEGKANLQIECVKIDNGIPQPAPQAIVQPLTITKEEWKMEGVSFKEAAPEESSDETPEKKPTDSAPAPAPAPAPAAPKPGENDQEAPNKPSPDEVSPGNADTGKADSSKQAPAKPSKSSKPAGQASGARGFMPRTGAEIAATAVLALALIGGGIFAVVRMRKN
ncbi:hypothetical protein HMPREF1484_00673 [Dermabacter sp. HFH0086]|uniref:hypothetical protein n=1 Tax=Dermabacter TaxID=36739 RepID=UPI0003539DCC|nr:MULTISPECIES: hypothetical protein [Dermabacter]EPH16791.1 hypothetical protein HMPREF1484_00673 [Dermabacter sp. HFH0086]